jgi:hypothetical protein
MFDGLMTTVGFLEASTHRRLTLCTDRPKIADGRVTRFEPGDW